MFVIAPYIIKPEIRPEHAKAVSSDENLPIPRKPIPKIKDSGEEEITLLSKTKDNSLAEPVLPLKSIFPLTVILFNTAEYMKLFSPAKNNKYTTIAIKNTYRNF